MYLRTLVITIVLGALIVFAAINWTAFVSPFTLSVGFTTVEAPLGLVLLGMVGLLTLLFLIYVVYLQSSVLLETRRHARELQAQRDLADQAEASRFDQLYSFVEGELKKLTLKIDGAQTDVLGSIERLRHEVHSTAEQSVNTLSAYLGEIDDRLARAGDASDTKSRQ